MHSWVMLVGARKCPVLVGSNEDASGGGRRTIANCGIRRSIRLVKDIHVDGQRLNARGVDGFSWS